MDNPGGVRVIYPIAALLCLLLMAGGLVLGLGPMRQERGLIAAALLTSGLIGLIGTLFTWPLALLLSGISSSSRQSAVTLQEQDAKIKDISRQLAVLIDQQLISDRTKALAYREKDRDTLRRAVQEEIARKDWDSARALTDQIGQLGYVQEAQKLRMEIDNLGDESARLVVSRFMQDIDRLMQAEQWPAARQLARQLAQDWPNRSDAQGMIAHVEDRFATTKSKLMDDWNRSLANHDLELGAQTLKHIDAYLTPPEAAAMQETARALFKERLTVLREQFASAVKEKKWADALKLGESLIADYPSTRVAAEVSEAMPSLRQRVTEGS